MQAFSDLFSPNKALRGRTLLLLCLAQGALVLLFWSLSGSAIFPTPAAIGRAWVSLFREGGFVTEALTSTILAFQSVALTFLLSLLFSYASVLPFFRPAVQAASKLRFLSLVGLSFLFTMVFSGGHQLKVSLLVFGMSVFFITSMVEVIQSVPRSDLNHARTMGMNEWQVVWEVIVLGKMDQAFEILRQNFAIAWMMLTMVEGISRAEGGIGTMLLNQNKHFHLDAVFAIQFTVIAIGILMDYGFGVLRRFLFPFAALGKEAR